MALTMTPSQHTAGFPSILLDYGITVKTDMQDTAYTLKTVPVRAGIALSRLKTILEG